MMQEEELTERLLNQSKGSEFDATYQVVFIFSRILKISRACVKLTLLRDILQRDQRLVAAIQSLSTEYETVTQRGSSSPSLFLADR